MSTTFLSPRKSKTASISLNRAPSSCGLARIAPSPTLVIAEAFLSRFGLDHSSVHVSHHYPEDFRDAFEEIAGRNSFPFGGCNFRLRCWSPRDHATRAAMRFYVHLSLEGLPLHLWSESFAAKVFGRSCLLHFAKEHYRRESTDTFELMAWTADLAAIPL
jgi:hypothetical protein